MVYKKKQSKLPGPFLRILEYIAKKRVCCSAHEPEMKSMSVLSFHQMQRRINQPRLVRFVSL